MAQNFSILENGKPVALSVFEAIEDGASATSSMSESSPQASLSVRAEAPPARSLGQRIVIVTDPSALNPMQLARVRDATPASSRIGRRTAISFD